MTVHFSVCSNLWNGLPGQALMCCMGLNCRAHNAEFVTGKSCTVHIRPPEMAKLCYLVASKPEVYLLSGLMLPARGRAGVGSLLCQVDIGRIITDLAGSCVEYSQRKLFLTNELLSHR